MLSHRDKSEHIRPGGSVVGALMPGRCIAPSGSAWAGAVLDKGLNRAEPRSFMRHSRWDIKVAQPEYRRATEHRRAEWEGIVH